MKATLYVAPDDPDVARRTLCLRRPLTDLDAKPTGAGVRLHIFDEQFRPGYDQECMALVLEETDDAIIVVPLWARLGFGPEWDTSPQVGGSRNHLTFGWRWQWHPIRVLNWDWFQRWPVLFGTDELCNKSIEVRVPFGAICLFWKRPYRTREDGRCEECMSA